MGNYRSEIESKEGKEFPSFTYKKVVLEPAYDEAKENFVDYMMQINIAHLVMLQEQGLVNDAEAQKIGKAISEINREFYKTSSYDAVYEDLFFRIEHDLITKAGDIAGNLHIARSRNDMGIALYRMTIRKKLLKLMKALLSVQESLHAFANDHIETIMIGYTHTQQAQPTTLAHYMKGLIDKLDRDFIRLQAAYKTVNRSSMGAAALTTSGFAISRERMQELLSFDDIIENSWDSVAGADYLMEVSTAVQLASLSLGRSVQDLLTWATQEFNVVKMANPYVQVSSIMPQKRNPVSLEHARSLLSTVVGDANTVLTMIHNTPFGDINDTEDDLQPYLWRPLDQLSGIYELFASVIVTMSVNKEGLEKRARESFANVTELADTLVRFEKISFRQAHHIVSNAVRALDASGKEKLSDFTYDLVNQESMNVIKRPLTITEEQFKKALCPRNFVELRTILGGPAPKTMINSLSKSRSRVTASNEWVDKKIVEIEKAEAVLEGFAEQWRESK
ncbi:argininosuccinate lyase [Sporosarcina jiandibaonis]|uniref:argininosuccinate lyase n=1 Tax=Sporosarcina jiandibaonis TaxID=2715535 RepID=UPI001551799D|nr:argininosuccinate lyase [Sporosarcina jiandibaonis]